MNDTLTQTIVVVLLALGVVSLIYLSAILTIFVRNVSRLNGVPEIVSTLLARFAQWEEDDRREREREREFLDASADVPTFAERISDVATRLVCCMLPGTKVRGVKSTLQFDDCAREFGDAYGVTIKGVFPVPGYVTLAGFTLHSSAMVSHSPLPAGRLS